MPNNDEFSIQAQKHNAVMRVAFEKEIAATIEAAQIIESGYAPEPAEAEAGAQTQVSFAPGNLVDAIYAAEKPVAVLDPGSYRYAGGGYMRGWSGPEEDLCGEGNLQLVLEAFQKSYYGPNRQTASGELYTSRALALPGVRFTRHGEIVAADVCVISPPNKTRALERNRSQKEYELALADRIESALRILASFGAQTVVIPSFGFGKMGNSAKEVAELMRAWIEAHEGLIPHIVFALWRGPEADEFQAVFADRIPDEEEIEEQPVDEEEDDDWESDWEKYRISE